MFLFFVNNVCLIIIKKNFIEFIFLSFILTSNSCVCYVNAEESCSLPNIPENGRISSNEILINYPLNSVVQFTCYSGFQLLGDGSVTCMSTDTWSSDDIACVGESVCEN